MIVVTVDTWVSIGGFVAVGTGLYTAMRSEFGKVNRKLDEYRLEAKADVVGLRTELKADITSLRTELKADIQRVDDRVYALAAGLKPQIERADDDRRAG